jgi:hypothetical protein
MLCQFIFILSSASNVLIPGVQAVGDSPDCQCAKRMDGKVQNAALGSVLIRTLPGTDTPGPQTCAKVQCDFPIDRIEDEAKRREQEVMSENAHG